MKLTVKLDFGSGREMKVGTFSESGATRHLSSPASFFRRD